MVEIEQSPYIWINTIIEILKSFVPFAKNRNYYIKGISLTSQRSSLICLNKKGEPIGNAIMWQDKRANIIVEEMKDESDFIFNKTGANLNAVYLAPKILWMKKNNPNINGSILKYLTIADYIAYALTGELKTDMTYGSRTLLMNIHTKQWDEELLELFSIHRKELCDLIEPGDIIGYLSEEITKEIGMNESIPLISAGGDQQCGAIGLGLLDEGNIEITLGTGGYLTTIKNEIPENLTNDITINYFSIKNKYMLETNILSCTSLLEWFLRNFYEGKKSKQELYKQIEHDLSSVPVGSNGVIVQPNFQGRGTPDWNSNAKGSFLNLTLANDKKDMLNALIEGIGIEILNNIEVLKRYSNESHKKVYLSGGLSNNQTITQIIADIISEELIVYSNSEATALGAFVISSIKLGFFKNYNDALISCRNRGTITRFYPDKEKSPLYKKLQERHREFYYKLK